MPKLKSSRKPKTRYSAYAAMSIDGRISLDSKKLPDWTSKEDWKFFQTALKKTDAVVSGHATYNAAKKYMDRRVSYVFTSKTNKPRSRGSVTFVNPKKSDLKKMFGGYKNVAIVGGAGVYQTMLDRGLFDDLYLTIEPLIFGRGRELFSGGKKNTSLKLKSVKKLNKTGTLLLHYTK